jgi:putative RecB family exonuclease
MLKKLNDFMVEKNNIKLSPTGIACYYECPRKFYFIYVRGIEEKPTPSKVRGKIVHHVLENFFNFVNLASIQQEHWHDLWKKFRNVLISMLESEWKQIGKIYEDCFESEKQKEDFLDETKNFLDFYAVKLAFSLTNKMKELDKNSEWFESDLKRFFYPKDMEMKLELNEEGMAGFVDKTMSLFGNGIAIVDYKTTKCPLPHFIPETHLKQGKAYAFLWSRVFNELPKHVSFYYLRTGESVFYPISERDIEEIKKDIETIRSKKQTIEEFPKKESKLCDFCDFKVFCSEKKETD